MKVTTMEFNLKKYRDFLVSILFMTINEQWNGMIRSVCNSGKQYGLWVVSRNIADK